jgi:hypothetical protein
VLFLVSLTARRIESKLYTTPGKFERPHFYHGQVWLFLRRPVEKTAAR